MSNSSTPSTTAGAEHPQWDSVMTPAARIFIIAASGECAAEMAAESLGSQSAGKPWPSSVRRHHQGQRWKALLLPATALPPSAQVQFETVILAHTGVQRGHLKWLMYVCCRVMLEGPCASKTCRVYSMHAVVCTDDPPCTALQLPSACWSSRWCTTSCAAGASIAPTLPRQLRWADTPCIWVLARWLS
jgi:hypothetical protein